MAVLSREQIVGQLSSRKLYVGPILADNQIGKVSVDLRMGNLALVIRAKGVSYVDPASFIFQPKEHDQERGKRQKFDRVDIPFHQPFVLHPGSLALVPTLEWVKLPADLKGIVTARSSWAREGLNIATANFIDPGYRGIVTLELSNLGQIPIAIYPGMRVAQIAFHTVDGDIGYGAKKEPQFDLNIEPSSGNLTRQDEAFISRERRNHASFDEYSD